MPLFTYQCADCSARKEHFVNATKELKCPKCESDRYTRLMSKVKIDREYVDREEFLENKVSPHVAEVYEKIGREAMSEDTKTLEDLFGSEEINRSISKYDE